MSTGPDPQISGLVKAAGVPSDVGVPPAPGPGPAMLSDTSLHARIEALAERHRRFAPDAYHFVFAALDYVLERQEAEAGDDRRLRPDRHVSALQLLEGLRAYALDQFGPLARLVLERWGVATTEDFGSIVFDLVDGRLLNKQDSDRPEDFRNGFNFREAFDRAWRTGTSRRR